MGLLNTAMASAKEIVLSNELYELIPEPLDPPNQATETPPSLDCSYQSRGISAGPARSTQRPSEQIENLIAQIWPDPDFLSTVFRIKARFGSTPDTSWQPARRTTAAAGPSPGPAGRGTGGAGVQPPSPRRPARAVHPHASLFDEPANQPTDPRSIDPGGQPLTPPVKNPPENIAAPTPTAPIGSIPQEVLEEQLEELSIPVDWGVSGDLRFG